MHKSGDESTDTNLIQMLKGVWEGHCQKVYSGLTLLMSFIL